MPALHFFTSPGQLTSGEKAELAKVLTSHYSKYMPAFFVNIMFHELPEDSFFVGGELTEGKFIRLSLEHIAVNFSAIPDGDAQARKFLDSIGSMFKERFEARGWRYEYNIIESEAKYWRIQGFEIPPLGSEPIKLWDARQRGVEWDKSNI